MVLLRSSAGIPFVSCYDSVPLGTHRNQVRYRYSVVRTRCLQNVTTDNPYRIFGSYVRWRTSASCAHAQSHQW
jgi:hypothetical protein